jgi:hypothetical protein
MWKGKEELGQEGRYSSLTRTKNVVTEENMYTGCTQTSVFSIGVS